MATLTEKLAETWPAKMARALLEGVTLPGDVYSGKTQVTDADGRTNPEVINRSAELAGLMVGAPGGVGGLGSGARVAKSALPMDEASRMARAAEQGYSIDAYKGMNPYDANTVPEYYGSGRVVPGTEHRIRQELTQIDARKMRGGDDVGFFSNDPAVGSRFAEIMRGSVYPVKLRMENPKIIDAEGRRAADFQFGKGEGQLQLPKDSPHDGVILKNTKDEGDIYLPREPQQVRSRWAAYDPANEGSGYLLGSGAVDPRTAAMFQALMNYEPQVKSNE